MSGGSFIKVSAFPQLPLQLAVFGPANHMLQDSEAVFTPLKADSMTVAQKNFLAAQCTDEFKVGDIDIRLGDSGRQLIRRYGLPVGTVGRWTSNLKKGKPNYDSRGRPEALDEQGKSDFLAEVALGKEIVTGKGNRRDHKDIVSKVLSCSIFKMLSNDVIGSMHNELHMESF